MRVDRGGFIRLQNSCHDQLVILSVAKNVPAKPLRSAESSNTTNLWTYVGCASFAVAGFVRGTFAFAQDDGLGVL